MIHYLTLFIALLFSHGPLISLVLKDRIAQSMPGDYIVVSICQMNTLMHIAARFPSHVILEEITVPANKQKNNIPWKEWVRNGAHGHIAWVFYQINLDSGQIDWLYSLNKGQWCTPGDKGDILTILMKMHFEKLQDYKRKKIGPAPSSGPDFRALWVPKMIFEGKIVPNVQFDVWRGRWPFDQSDLSGRTIDIYLPTSSGAFPSHFPYWIQVNGVMGKGKIRIIDSGINLQSPATPPQIEKQPIILNTQNLSR